MDLSASRPWSNKRLKYLGKALMAGATPPDGCPHYDEVMIWHNDLAAAVKSEIQAHQWALASADDFDVTARSKTRDTLVQKLVREQGKHLTLDKVQDLAGVRIDSDFVLDQQLAFAHEVADHFGETSIVRDIRIAPHSGYRAVHVWLRLPCGNVEVQIRTQAQSAWANTYERLGDLLGRGIRYGAIPEDEPTAEIVRALHKLSDEIADAEKLEQNAVDLQEWVSGVPDVERDEKHDELEAQISVASREVRAWKERYITQLNELKRMLDGMESL
jgi:ppGpp synthetase/RelA/SpoT-type nucleotidyltranferase